MICYNTLLRGLMVTLIVQPVDGKYIVLHFIIYYYYYVIEIRQ